MVKYKIIVLFFFSKTNCLRKVSVTVVSLFIFSIYNSDNGNFRIFIILNLIAYKINIFEVIFLFNWSSFLLSIRKIKPPGLSCLCPCIIPVLFCILSHRQSLSCKLLESEDTWWRMEPCFPGHSWKYSWPKIDEVVN